MRSLSRMKNDRDLVNTLSSSSLSYTFTWVISRMCIEVPNLVIYNSNLRHRYMAIRLLWLLSNKGLLRLHILFFFVIEKCEASAIFGSFELYLRTKQLILSPENFFLLPSLWYSRGISRPANLRQLSDLYSFRRALLTTTLQGSTIPKQIYLKGNFEWHNPTRKILFFDRRPFGIPDPISWSHDV